MIKAGIIGAAGYTAGELIRLLLNHPEVVISYAHSNSQAGKPVSSTHQDLLDVDLVFTNEHQDVDVVFLCLGHGNSRAFLEANPISKTTRIIDLSQDFRHKANATFQGRSYIYGLPELNHAAVTQTQNIANPGCFATAIQLALLPLASQGLLNSEVHVNAITGSTGAGQKPQATTHFSWRNDNVSIYKAFDHQHLTEIKESLMSLQSNFDKTINFLPMRGNFARGILASAYTYFDGSEEDAVKLYSDYYADAPFTKVTTDPIHLKQVVNTNFCLLQVQKIENKVLITSAIDNLLKGASGQAVENMNLMFDIPQKTGLGLKASYF